MKKPGGTIAVIGAGIVGMQIARKLQREGEKVILIDQDDPGMACSFGNAGYIAVDEILPLARPGVLLSAPKMLIDPLAPLALDYKSLPFLAPFFVKFMWACRPSQVKIGTKALIQLTQNTIPSWERVIKAEKLDHLIKRKGMLRAYENEKTFRSNFDEFIVQKECGIHVKKLSRLETHDLVPCFSNKIIRGAYYEDGINTTNPHALTKALFEAFTQDGGKFLKTKVEGFILTNGVITAISTATKPLKVDKVIVAAGALSKDLIQPLGYSIPLVAERGYHLMKTDIDNGPEVPIAVMDRNFFVTPMDMGLRLAGTVEFTHPSSEPNWARSEVLADHLDDIMPDIGGTYGEKWHGNRPTLPDYLPMIGQAPHHKNLYTAIGHQHLGLTLSALTAEIITHMVNGKGSRDIQSINLAPFKVDRFL
jgi:D-amino-acid dehydrogenase